MSQKPQLVVVWWHRHIESDPASTDFNGVVKHYYVGDHTLVLSCESGNHHHITVANVDTIKFIAQEQPE